MAQKPDLVCVNETFLSHTIEHINIQSNLLITKLDKFDGRKCGEIILFAARNISQGIVVTNQKLRNRKTRVASCSRKPRTALGRSMAQTA